MLTSPALTDSCAIFKYGRVAFDVDGLSHQCCSNMAQAFDSRIQQWKGRFSASVAEQSHSRWPPSPMEEQAASKQLMMTLMSSCCSESDQGVLATLVPEEPPQAAGKLQNMCASMGPHINVLELFGIAPVLRRGGLLAATKTTTALPSISFALAAAIGGLAGAVVTSVMVVKFTKITLYPRPLLG